MSEETYKDEMQKNSRNRDWFQSSPINSFVQLYFQAHYSTNFQQYSQTPILHKKHQKGKLKKQPQKYVQTSCKSLKKLQRDIKKYARFDIMNGLHQKFIYDYNICCKEFKNTVDKYHVCYRSLKYTFLTFGFLNEINVLDEYLKFFKQNVNALIKAKYSHRNKQFNQLLNKAITEIEKSINLLLQGKYLEGNLKGRTKNPAQMEKCQKLYSDIFPIQKIRSNSYDLDII